MRSRTLVPGHATQQGLATHELSSSALHRLSLRFLHPRSSRWKRVLAVCWLVQTQSRADRIPPYLQMLSLLFWFIFKWALFKVLIKLYNISCPLCLKSQSPSYVCTRTHTHAHGSESTCHKIPLSRCYVCVCSDTEKTFSIMSVCVCVCV